jgi:hypothetical protein
MACSKTSRFAPQVERDRDGKSRRVKPGEHHRLVLG